MSSKILKFTALNLLAASLSISVAMAQVPATNTPYLALGDSIAFGFNPQIQPPDLSQYHGYPALLSDTLNLQLTNASCPGETSGTLAGTSSKYLVGFNCAEQSSAHELFVSYGGGSQLQYAISHLQEHPETSLVTINIGGNDLGNLQISCGGNVACETLGLPAVLLTVGRNLNAIFAGLRKTGYKGPIVALNYYAFNYKDAFQVSVFTGLNTVIATTALGHKVAVADGFRAFQAASASTNGDPCAAGLLLKDPGTATCGTHPSYAGQALLAATVFKAIPKTK